MDPEDWVVSSPTVMARSSSPSPSRSPPPAVALIQGNALRMSVPLPSWTSAARSVSGAGARP